MSKSIYEIQGFDELQNKIKRLPDKVKKREMIKILRASAKSTVAAARDEAPKSKKAHWIRGKKIQPGNLKKSIKVAVLRRSRNPNIVVGPRSSGKFDGFYGRQFIIKGTTGKSAIKANPFMERAQRRTEGKVTIETVSKTEKYIQKQIDRL